MKKNVIATGAFLLLTSTQAWSQSQQVRVSVESVSTGQYQANVYYQPSDGRRTTGLGIRVHYPASVIQLSDPSQVLSGITGLQIQPDEADYDNSLATDSFLNAAWFDLNGNWPAASGEVLLYSIKFVLKQPQVASNVTFNVSRVSTAVGYVLQAGNFQSLLGGSVISPGGDSNDADETITQAILTAQQTLDAPQSPAEIVAAVDAVSDAIVSDISDVDAERLRRLADDAIRAGTGFFAEQITPDADDRIQALIAANPAALRFALNASPALRSEGQVDVALLQQVLTQQGLDSSHGTRLAESLSSVLALDKIHAGGKNAQQVLQAAFGSSATVSTELITGTTNIVLAGERYHGAVLAVRLVGNLLPTGLRFLSDGSALFVHDGFGFEIAPLPADLPGFMAAVERESFKFSLRNNAAIELELGGGQRFWGVVAYNNLVNAESSCGAISFAAPKGAENSPGYSYTVNCANGIQQNVVPFVQHSGFFALQGNAASGASVDRNTGVIDIPDTGKFKPGFFVSPLNADDLIFYQANRTVDGLALRAMDVNADGRLDFLLYTDAGVQPIFAVAN